MEKFSRRLSDPQPKPTATLVGVWKGEVPKDARTVRNVIRVYKSDGTGFENGEYLKQVKCSGKWNWKWRVNRYCWTWKADYSEAKVLYKMTGRSEPDAYGEVGNAWRSGFKLEGNKLKLPDAAFYYYRQKANPNGMAAPCQTLQEPEPPKNDGKPDPDEPGHVEPKEPDISALLKDPGKLDGDKCKTFARISSQFKQHAQAKPDSQSQKMLQVLTPVIMDIQKRCAALGAGDGFGEGVKPPDGGGQKPPANNTLVGIWYNVSAKTRWEFYKDGTGKLIQDSVNQVSGKMVFF